MSLNSFYNSKYNNADIINYKYSSFVPKINNSKPNFFPKIHSKFSQKYAPIIKTTFGVSSILIWQVFLIFLVAGLIIFRQHHCCRTEKLIKKR